MVLLVRVGVFGLFGKTADGESVGAVITIGGADISAIKRLMVGVGSIRVDGRRPIVAIAA